MLDKANASEEANPDVAFLKIGGFLYFNKDYSLIAINALKPCAVEDSSATNKLYFTSSTPLPAKVVQKMLRRPLHAITLKQFLENKATYFSWVPSNEYVPSPHGGFAYIGVGL